MSILFSDILIVFSSYHSFLTVYVYILMKNVASVAVLLSPYGRMIIMMNFEF